MFVTCYYDIYNDREKFVMYLDLFSRLGNSGLPILLFTDPSLVSYFTEYKFVTVIGITLELCELYSIGMKCSAPLPSVRNIQKDTKEYLSLINTKIEFIKKASDFVKDDTFIWVDFGIFKIIKDSEGFLHKLKDLHEHTYTNIVLPGCWNAGAHYSNDTVNWRFCGGIIIIPREHIDTFYNHSKSVLIHLCEHYKLVWEVNVWYIIEHDHAKDIIHWYSADHNDSIVRNFNMLYN